MFLKCLLECFRCKWLAQFSFQIDHLRACPLSDFNDLATEETQAAGNKRIARLEQITQYCLGSREAGAGYTQRHLVFRLEYLAQKLRRLFEDRKKFRVDMPKLRRRGDAQNARINITGTRAKQQPVRRIDFG